MAILYLNNHDELKYTKKDVIMQRSNLINKLRILIPRYYGTTVNTEEDVDMLDGFEVYLHYVTPISKHHKMIPLTLENENFNNSSTNTEIVMSYKIPLTLELTAESGNLEVWLAFYKVDISINDENKLQMDTPVRISKSCQIPITKVSDYDDLMVSMEHSAITNKILELKKLINLANESDQDLTEFIPTDVQITEHDDKIHLINKDDLPIGNGISMGDIAQNVGIKNVGEDSDGVQDGVTDLDAALEQPSDNEDNSGVIDLDKEINSPGQQEVIDLDSLIQNI